MGVTVISILLLVSHYQLLLSTVHDSVVFLHEVLVVEKWSMNIIRIYLILQKVEISTFYNGYAMNYQTLAAFLRITKTPHNISNVWYQWSIFFIVASRHTYNVTRISHNYYTEIPRHKHTRGFLRLQNKAIVHDPHTQDHRKSLSILWESVTCAPHAA